MSMARFLQNSPISTDMPFLAQVGILEHYMLLEHCIRANHDLIHQVIEHQLGELQQKTHLEEDWLIEELVKSVSIENATMLLELAELKSLVQDYCRRGIMDCARE